jgi:hypothetical protein
MIIRSTLGLSFGVVFSVLLFKRRAWPAWVGLGFGAGRAWEEADCMWKTLPVPLSQASFTMAKELLDSQKLLLTEHGTSFFPTGRPAVAQRYALMRKRRMICFSQRKAESTWLIDFPKWFPFLRLSYIVLSAHGHGLERCIINMI